MRKAEENADQRAEEASRSDEASLAEVVFFFCALAHIALRECDPR